jgi:ribosomal protein L11 methyltransferase
VTWRMLRVRTRRRDAVSTALFDAGALAVEDSGEDITTHFPDEPGANAAADAVRRADPSADITFADSPDVDYSQWRASVRAWEIGELTVAPPWLAAGRDNARSVVIDPALAFGTGEHPTTRGALALVQRVLRPGDFVADLGTGSGVLAIAAAKLGAARVVGIEHDPNAAASAEGNVRVNGVGERVTIIAGDAGTLLPLIAPVRLILANIASLALLQLLPSMHDALTSDGEAVISGILGSEAEAYRPMMRGWQITREHLEDEWWTAAIARL